MIDYMQHAQGLGDSELAIYIHIAIWYQKSPINIVLLDKGTYEIITMWAGDLTRNLTCGGGGRICQYMV